ncbi:MAG TPA: dienelactone hydrolase family protein [Nocardioides sp.]|nr:dienelactone hydrolase family protein [Nocardioides sp.]
MATPQTVGVPTPDGTADAIVVTGEGPGPHPGVLLYMDAFGPRPRLAEMAARLAEHGYTVLVPNVFHRNRRAPLVDVNRLADPEQRRSLFGTLSPWMRATTPQMLASDNAAYLDYLLGLRDVTGPVGVVGYCFGGGVALRSAASRPDDVAAVAAFHPARLATDDPDSPHLLADRIRAEVYVGSADKDPGMPPEMQRRLDDALTEAGVEHTCEQYDGAQHGFTMADTHVYDEAATERHWDALLDLFARRLRPRS